MKQVFLHLKTGQLELLETPTPLLKANGILVKNHFSVISAGTEMASLKLGQKSLIGKAKARPDLVRQVLGKIKTDGLTATLKAVQNKLDDWLPLGYSSAGEVMAVGEKVKEFKVGDHVACAGGNYASHAEIIYVPKNLCVKTPEELSLEKASLATIGAIALEGIRVLDLAPGEKVGVIGLGLIGQLTVQILKAYGYPVIGFDIDKKQIERASKFGLDKNVNLNEGDPLAIVAEFTDNQGLDAVIITAATKSNQPIELAGEITRKKGKISVVGDVSLKIPRKTYYEKELKLTISCSYGPGRYDKNYEEGGIDYPFSYVRWTEKRNIEEIIRLMSEKKIDVESLITHRFDIEDALSAYDIVSNKKPGEEVVAVILKYSAQTKIQPKVTYQQISKKNQPKDHINIGLIGVGNFTKATILPCLKKIKNISVFAAADTSGREASHVIKKFNGKYATTDYKEIIKDPDIDLVIIATRHDLHAKITIEALENNKNVHVEKPLCLTEEELKQIINVAQKSKGRLVVGFNRRFAPHSLMAQQKINHSQPLMIYARMNAGFIPQEHWVHNLNEGGGRILGEACHLVDLMRFITQSPIIQVYARVVPLGNGIQTEDNVFVNLDFKNGSKGTILYTSMGNKMAPKEYVEIFNNNKVIAIDNFKSAKVYAQPITRKHWLMNQDKGHFNEFQSFIEAIRQGKPSPITINELNNVSLATIKIIESIRTNKPVAIDVYET